MKAAQKNSLLNYFPKKKSSDVESNAEKNEGEMEEQSSCTRKGDELLTADKKEKKQNVKKEIGAKENQSSCTKGKPMLEGGKKPVKNFPKRKRKEAVDDSDEEDGGNKKSGKFKTLSKEVRAAIAIAQLMELSDDDEGDALLRALDKNKKSQATSADVKEAKKPPKNTKKQNGRTFKSTVNSPKVEISTEINAKEKGKKSQENTSLPKKNKESDNTTENIDEECRKNINYKKETEKSPKKIAHSVNVGERPKKDISSFFTKLKSE